MADRAESEHDVTSAQDVLKWVAYAERLCEPDCPGRGAPYGLQVDAVARVLYDLFCEYTGGKPRSFDELWSLNQTTFRGGARRLIEAVSDA